MSNPALDTHDYYVNKKITFLIKYLHISSISQVSFSNKKFYALEKIHMR